MEAGDDVEDGTLLLADGRRLGYAQYGRPDGEPREIQPEVHLWQGEADTLVPPAIGTYQASQIPRCHPTLVPDEGHLLIIDRMPDLAAALCQTAPPR